MCCTKVVKPFCIICHVVLIFFRDKYVDLYMDYIVNKSVEKYFIAFSSGFHRVCGGRVLVCVLSFNILFSHET